METLRGFMQDNGLRLSASLAFYAAFSIAPLLLVAISLAGAVAGDDAVRGVLEDELSSGMGPTGAFVIQDMVAHARKPSDNLVMSMVGIGLLLFGASGVFGELQASLDRMWNVETPPSHGVKGFIRDRFLSFAMVLGTGFLLLVSMLLTTCLQVVTDRVGRIAEMPPAVWNAAAGILSFAVIALLFAAIFKVLPNVKIEWNDVWAGAIFTSGLFVVGKVGIAWYLSHAATESSYGSAAALVLVLMWLHYSSMILLFGAEFTQVYASRRGVGITSRPATARVKAASRGLN
ncbi:YihY/virulence factor BrkB family protein [Luteolibacter luteus]|uniref:YihY/virulence factor BrkB family protein n=1 Tax=Luteolibacter luteus TaxID=2728835 RepID=A0A858RPA6_9BACT|nr:YihY/virulence factor BrkB family protein [Luteolibacter luteus]QJE97763.1 YihY/virulence factor BrkB family protein [Luteolibacter luteus]